MFISAVCVKRSKRIRPIHAMYIRNGASATTIREESEVMSEKSKISFPGLKIGRSLKLRLFIIIFLAGIIPCTIIYQVILSNYEDRAVKVRISDVQNQLKIIADHLITYNYLPDSSSEVINAELEQLSNLYNGRVMIINGSLKIVKDTYGLSEGKTIVSEEVIKCFKGSNTANYDRVNGFIEITVPIMETISEQNATPEQPEGTEVVRGVMLTSVSTDSIAMTLSILSRKALIIEIIMALCILALAIILAKILIRPFDRVSGAISEVQEGYTNETISVPDYIETEHIVDAFNSVLQRMNALDETRQDFVANVSHELKTPITSMKVLADSLIAQEDVPVELYREFMVDIAEEIEREDKIINDLLALVKMDKSAASVNITSVDINALTELILRRLRPIAKKTDIELTLISKREIIAEVDEVKLSLILTNLIENAIKYNREQGKVNVILDADHQFFTVQVADTGIGIPEDSIQHIYERFYRVDKSHSREIGGTGLGLAITKALTEMMGGKINVSSQFGKGSVFVINLPQKVSKFQRPMTDKEIMDTASKLFNNVNNKVTSIDYGHKKILIVDDNKLNIKVARRALSDFDFEIDECYDGIECLNKVVVGNEYDLILMDIMMPNMSGETAMKKLKENLNFKIPVIALTADAVAGAKEKYVSEGFVDYIAKPFNKEQIKQKLDTVFNVSK